MKWTVVYRFSLLIVILAFTRVPAQDAANRFRFKHITVNEGLSHSDAMAVAQDQQGFTWIGTNKGIDRYDGYTLKKYNLPINPETGMSANRIRSLHVSNTGELWVGVERSGLFWYDPDKDCFVSLAERAGADAFPDQLARLSESNVNAITHDRLGRLWVGTWRYGPQVLTFGKSGDLTGWQTVHLTKPAPYEPAVNRMATDRQGRVWIGTFGTGLWVVDGLARKLPQQAAQIPQLSHTTIRAMHADRHGDLWIGTDNRVLWSGAPALAHAPNLIMQPFRRTFAGLESLYLDSADRLWISTNYGLLLVEAGVRNGQTMPVAETRVQTFLPQDTDPYSINSVRVHDILEDRFHNLWLATSAGGLNQVRLQAQPFGLLRRQLLGQTSPANNYINAICEDKPHNLLWIGTRNGLAAYDPVRKTYQNYLSRVLSGDVNGVDVSALFMASDGTLWIGTRYNGLYRFRDRQPERIAESPQGPKWYDLSIEHITEDRFGTIWVASFNAGLHRYTRQGRYLSPAENVLKTRQITSLLYEPQQDILWVSTRDAGVLKTKITADTIRLLKRFAYVPKDSSSLATNYTWPLLKDQQGDLWIGTIGGGLHRLRRQPAGQEHIERFQKWLPETDVESLLTDAVGNLWVGGAGLFRFSPATKALRHYDVTDGLQSNAFKVGAALRAQDGTMYFGGTNGITYFRPAALQTASAPPVVQITGLRIMNQAIGIGDTRDGDVVVPCAFAASPTVTIHAADNDFSVEFVALNYLNPTKHQYAYQLVGYNRDWVQPAPGQRSASFANLPPGNYTFLVKASNGDGVWSAKPAMMQFRVLPPWWRTWWACMLYLLAGTGALLVYRRVTGTQRELKNKLAFEQFKNDKEKELTDLKMAFFTNVSHELRTPLTLILGPMEELATSQHPLTGYQDRIVLMHQQTRKLFDLVNQLLDFRKVESGHVSLQISRGNIIEFLTEIFLIFRLKAEEHALDYRMALPEEPVPLYFDRSKLEIVLTNLLSNALKYTPDGGKIRLSATITGHPEQESVRQAGKLTNNFLEIRVQDWGVGMPAEELDRIFDPYYQASHTRTLRMIGSGIGLSLVKQFVAYHAGEITVDSAVQQGTTFTLRLPFGHSHFAPADIQEAGQPGDLYELPATGTSSLPDPDAPDAEPMLPQSLRILLVEDNDEVRHYLQQLFEADFDVMTAPDGLEGWQKAQHSQPDLVISDIMMPYSDGLELCKRIKQHPKTMHIPVVLLTARAAAMHELEGLETGADDYVAKPFNPRLLYAKVTTLLRNRYKLREYYQRQILLEPTDVVIPDADKAFLEQAMRIVEAELQNPAFNVQTLVQEMGMSQSVFYRRLKSITGQTVVEFIRDVRMKRAARLLATSNLRVSEVAYQVGIEDIKYFRKSFQKIFSLSPSDYARQHRSTGIAEE
ncbi:hybrid sensor histidine kinase/response regulator transcription factor [Arsenicibacter rosenii]|uniref:histidine kinase n=1 Tax=Arsenicibacter rosenii TaxID=1750698 RepID=A0A1S2VMF4_9BACT|nr:two-component regulator propeller domain-containing protein [Arsenicibacter rosenii]OIN59951.1 hybrid sensor histidine kinase/response regulator [Arsenicibacter rosenii]